MDRDRDGEENLCRGVLGDLAVHHAVRGLNESSKLLRNPKRVPRSGVWFRLNSFRLI